MSFDRDAFWTELDELGEDEVRARLASHLYDSRKDPLVREWLRRQEASREDAVTREQLATARDAADAASRAAEAAESAAREARKANTNARIAQIIAAIAVIVSIAALFLKAESP